MRHFLFLLMFLPTLAFAKVEMFQIVVFDWVPETKTLKLVSMGSGTAVSKDKILTNRHVVQTGPNEYADFLLLCQAQVKAASSVVCDIPAGVASAHPTEDVAIVRPLESQFFPQVRLSHRTKRIGDPVRVFGFPTPNQQTGFGDTRTLAGFAAWEKDPSRPLKVIGDKLTVTRGEVTARWENTDTGFTYTQTDAQVNFGNSGGAAFDEYGDYLGIVTFKDPDGNSIFLEYHQIDDWVREYGDRPPNFEKIAFNFYKTVRDPRSKLTSTQVRQQQLRERLLKLKKSSQTRSVSGRTLTPRQQRLYEYLRQKRLSRNGF